MVAGVAIILNAIASAEVSWEHLQPFRRAPGGLLHILRCSCTRVELLEQLASHREEDGEITGSYLGKRRRDLRVASKVSPRQPRTLLVSLTNGDTDQWGPGVPL